MLPAAYTLSQAVLSYLSALCGHLHGADCADLHCICVQHHSNWLASGYDLRYGCWSLRSNADPLRPAWCCNRQSINAAPL